MQDNIVKTYRKVERREVASLAVVAYTDYVETEITTNLGNLSHEEMAEILEAVAGHFRKLDLPPKLKQVDGI